ncbi:MAG: thiamine phosphate synthase [Acutalibacteraceae bacterium]
MKLDTTLYFVTDSTNWEEKAFLDVVDKACAGGATIVQLREKNRTGREYLDLAIKTKSVTDKYNVPLIIDDRADIALAADAAGVHIGQSDLPVYAARKIMGSDKLVGATAKTVEQALKAQAEGADYLGVGAMYPTTTKVITVLTKPETLRDICAAVDIKVNAIGGLNKDNLDILKGIPIDGICAVSAIMKAQNPYEAAKELKAAFLRLNK